MITALSIILILANVIVSWKGFRDSIFYDKYKFHLEKVLVGKEYYRIFTSAFLHSGVGHLLWNMIALLAFSAAVEYALGTGGFILIYLGSMIGGKLFTMFVHRHHSDYTSVGASGAVNGIIFACIALFPKTSLGILFLPISIPAWIFGLIYVVFSIYGIRSSRGNVGHESHLGGALIGMFIALLIRPEAFVENYPVILLIAVPTIAFIAYTLLRPHSLIVSSEFRSKKKYHSVDDRYNAEKAEKQKELDRILDKINKKGMSSLTKKEKELLNELSKTFR